MSDEIDDIIAGYTGNQEPARITLASRDNYRVVQDPNTDLLRQIVMELRCMRHELDLVRQELRYASLSPKVESVEDEVRRMSRDRWYGVRPIFPPDVPRGGI